MCMRMAQWSMLFAHVQSFDISPTWKQTLCKLEPVVTWNDQVLR